MHKPINSFVNILKELWKITLHSLEKIIVLPAPSLKDVYNAFL